MSTAPSSLRRPLMPVRIVKREDTNMNSIRSRYYQKLGVFPSRPVSTATQDQPSQSDDQSIVSSVASSPVSFSPSLSSSPDSSVDSRPSLCSSSSCSSFCSNSSSSSVRSPSSLRHKRSVLQTTPAKHERVSFHPEVKLYRIKSHQDYSEQEWGNMWNNGESLDYAKDRCAFEFQAEGADWQNATEEADFMEGPDGELMHPATWFAYRHHWEAQGAEVDGQINFAALSAKSRPRRNRRSSWSPRPTQERKKSFWLLDLAIQSVQKGKEQSKNRRQERSRPQQQPRPGRHTDQGFP